ncbi:MAG: DUF3768 domain-containing protein [Proteobacteria bacterium]|nr:DUF3768 domain-containing protein [Pseudomonadota bacterium]
MTCTQEKKARIRELNDQLRQSLTGGRIMMTSGVEALGQSVVSQLLDLLRRYNQFDEGSDPYGEHDFGAFDHGGQKFFWKIDCYDLSMQFHSEDASDPNKTVRVLTLMLACEY